MLVSEISLEIYCSKERSIALRRQRFQKNLSASLTLPAPVEIRRSILIVVFIILEFVALLSFPKTRYIAGGDIFPNYFMPSNTVLASSTPIWGHSILGIGSPQFEPAFIVWGLLGKILAIIGVTGPIAQYIFLSSMLLWESYGIFTFVTAIFPEYPLSAAIASLGLPLSLYNVLDFRNPIQAFAIGYFALYAGFVWIHIQNSKSNWRLGASMGLASLGLPILAGTPPIVVIFGFWAVFWIIGAWWRSKQFRWTYPGVLLGLLFSLLLNAWWMVSAYFTLFADKGSVQQTFQGPLSWDWVDQHASIINLLTMQGFWSWPNPSYFSWASWYQHGPYHWTLYAPFILAIVSLILSPSWRVRALATLIIISLFIAKGVHNPLGFINRYLYLHVPYFWLLRDPQMEMDIILYLSLYTLAGIGLSELLVQSRKRLGAQSNPSLVVSASIVVVTLLINGAPLLNGTAYQGVISHSFKSAISIPSYWPKMANYLKKSGGPYGVLILPNDDFYQMPYSWGYYGTDKLAQTFIRQPITTLSPNPSGYFGGSSYYQTLLARLQNRIEYSPQTSIAPILQALGIRWVLQRNDVQWNVNNRHILSAPYLHYYYRQQHDLTRVKTIGPLTLYKVNNSSEAAAPFTGYRSAGVWESSSLPSLLTTASIAHGPVPWITHTSSHPQPSIPTPVQGKQWASYFSSRNFVAPTPGKVSISPNELQVSSIRTYHSVTLIFRGPGLTSHGHSLGRWQMKKIIPLSHSILPPTPLAVQIGQKHYMVPWGPSRGPIGSLGIAVGVQNLAVSLWAQRAAQPVTWSHIENCNRKPNSPSGTLDAIRSKNGTSVKLIGQNSGACVTNTSSIGVNNTANERLWISIAYRHVVGNSPGYAISEGTRATHIQLPSNAQWQTWNMWVNPITPTIHIYMYANSSQTRTINQYQATNRLYVPASNTAIIPIAPMTIPTPKGAISFTSPQNSSPPIWQSGNFNASHGLFNAYNRLRVRTGDLVGKKMSPQTFSLTARKDGIGYQTTIVKDAGHLLYISGEAKVTMGTNLPRFAILSKNNHLLWTAPFSSLPNQWQSFHKTLYISPRHYPIHLIFYSYAMSTSSETVLYRNVNVRAWPHTKGRITWITGTSSGPSRVSLIQSHATSDTVKVSQSTRLLVMHSAYSPYWVAQIQGHPSAMLHPVRVDGFLNGWIIPPHTHSLSIHVTFPPQTLYAMFLIMATLVAIILLAFITGPFRFLKGASFKLRNFSSISNEHQGILKNAFQKKVPRR